MQVTAVLPRGSDSSLFLCVFLAQLEGPSKEKLERHENSKLRVFVNKKADQKASFYQSQLATQQIADPEQI